MADSKRNDPEWQKAARDVGSALGGGARRLARGLRDLTKRPDDDDAAAPADAEVDASDTGESDEDLADKMKDLGRDFVDVMGKVSVTAGKKIRKAAWTAADTVRDTIKPDDD